MLDTTHNAAASLPQQAVAPHLLAPTPSGCRQTTWHVAATKPRAERIAHAALHHRGYAPYLPLSLGKPLFPGYCFLQLATNQPWYPIAWCPGVFSLLSTAGKPNVVARADIRAVQAAEALAASMTQDDTQWACGMPCRPRTGVVGGMDAVVLRAGKHRAIIAVIWAGSLHRVNLPISHLQQRSE